MQNNEKEWLQYSNRKILNIIAGVIAIGLTLLTFIIVLVILFFPIPSENETLVGQAFGTVLSLLGVVVAFFYGSNTTSKQDSETISTLAETAKAVRKEHDDTRGTKPGEADVKLSPGESVTVAGEEGNK